MVGRFLLPVIANPYQKYNQDEWNRINGLLMSSVSLWEGLSAASVWHGCSSLFCFISVFCLSVKESPRWRCGVATGPQVSGSPAAPLEFSLTRMKTENHSWLLSLDLHRHSVVKFFKQVFLKISLIYSFLFTVNACLLPIYSVIWVQITTASWLLLQPSPLSLSVFPSGQVYYVTPLTS